MNNTHTKNQLNNTNIHLIIKIIIIALSAYFSASSNMGAVLSVIITSFVTFCFFSEKLKVKLLFGTIYFALFGAIYFTRDINGDVFYFILKALDVIVPSYVLSYVYDKGESNLSNLVKTGTIANVCIAMLELARLKFIDKLDITGEYIKPYFNSIKDIYTQAITQNAQNLPENFSETFNFYFDTVSNYLVIFMPFILIASSAVASFFVIKISALLIGRITLKKSPYAVATPFEEYTAFRHSGLFILALFLITMGSGFNTFQCVCYNLIAFVYSEYILCGVAIIFYIIKNRMHAKGVFKYFIFFVSSILLLIISALMSPVGIINILALMGMFDANFNFRKLPKIKIKY